MDETDLPIIGQPPQPEVLPEVVPDPAAELSVEAQTVLAKYEAVEAALADIQTLADADHAV